jgi:hypothetical protein
MTEKFESAEMLIAGKESRVVLARAERIAVQAERREYGHRLGGGN